MKEPKIRFKGFRGEWEEAPFSETFDYLKNNSLSRAELSDGGVVMNIHYGDVLIKYGECVDVSKEVKTFVKEEYVAKKLHQSCAITNGDIIFADAAEDNTVGKCSEIIAKEDDAIVSGLHTIACRPKKDFAPMYLGYYLNSNAYHDQLLPHIQGTKISSISKKAISLTEISSPIDKNEQRAIASYFQRLDSLIQSTTKKIESLKQVKGASLQSMFPKEGETTPRVRFKGFEGEWEKVTIKDVATFLKGRGYSKSDLRVKGTPIILYGRIYTKYEACITNVDTYVNPLPNSIYTLGNEVVIPASGETPEDISCASAIKVRGIILGGDLNILRFDTDYYDTTFVAFSLSNGKAKKDLSNMAQGKSVVHLHNSDIEKVDMFIPSFVEQQQIASYFTNLDRQITLQTQRLEKLKQIKSACLDNMFV